MSYEVRGKVTKIFDTQTFDSGFTKREVIVTTEEQYPQELKMELIKEKVDLIDKFNVGDTVNVFFNLRGSQWNDRWFVNLQAWKIEGVDAGQPQAQAPASSAPSGNTPPPPSAPTPSDVDLGNSEEDDLPF